MWVAEVCALAHRRFGSLKGILPERSSSAIWGGVGLRTFGIHRERKREAT